MRHDPDFRDRDSDEDTSPGILDRLRVAAEAARGLFQTRGEIFREEMSEQASIFARGAAAFAIALALAAIMVLVLTALIVSLFALLFGSVWAGLLATLVLYLAVIAIAVTFGVKTFSKLRFDFPATKHGLSEDIAAVRSALKPPRSDAGNDVDLEERFRAGAE